MGNDPSFEHNPVSSTKFDGFTKKIYSTLPRSRIRCLFADANGVLSPLSKSGSVRIRCSAERKFESSKHGANTEVLRVYFGL